ncbi:MAG: bifunctional (p)ppGpp synthetase/guanosine-3',5'-bis(diphosphate) 3'-pyrophosphohydrolase [Bacteroidetes bacterium]|nr:bifunctional (p)ppGpp synthetase/guanosine-3',5'-bis(diphosphate) 3'-pyrophosphohydrolase [Bacteroidota bacterium]
MKSQFFIKKDKNTIKNKCHELLKKCKIFLEKKDVQLIRMALDIAIDTHTDTKSGKGETYIFHLISVAQIAVEEMGLSTTSIICSLLYDVVKLKNVSIEEIEEKFGKSVSYIIKGLVKVSELNTEKIPLQSENFISILLSIADDVRVVLIELANNFNCIRNFESYSEKEQKQILIETVNLYAPIAHRLGLYNIKTEMEDLSMKYTEPDIYQTIQTKLIETKQKRELYINKFIEPIAIELKQLGFDCEIKGRSKSVHSIWKKMQKQEVPFEEVYDIFAIRIIINNSKDEKADCWNIYSIITNYYQPNTDRLRDWITVPKGNGYESLHTTVEGSVNKWIEIQIRTKRMDEVAEKGLAAHWKYKEASKNQVHDNWLKKVREVIENPTAKGLYDVDKADKYSSDVYVFTPNGDIKKLRSGATVLDFAYSVHSNVGDTCTGAKVNDKIVPIKQVLANGDRVEILTSKNQKPKLDWLSFVISPRAKNKINRAINEIQYRDAEEGKDILKRKLKQLKVEFNDENVFKLVTHFKFKKILELYQNVGNGKIDFIQIKEFFTILEKEEKKKLEKKNTEKKDQQRESFDKYLFSDKDLDKIDFSIANCCKPKSGEKIFGFVTVDKGITIHKTSCPNASYMIKNFPYRVIKIKWSKKEKNNIELINKE